MSAKEGMSKIPVGLCQCGCGGTTTITRWGDKAIGYVKGEPKRFIRGHFGKGGTALTGPQTGPWKGERAGYNAFHGRVTYHRGQPSYCEHCKTTEDRRYEWASLTKNYEDVNDYVRLCVPCHRKLDGSIRNIRGNNA